jgi:integrase
MEWQNAFVACSNLVNHLQVCLYLRDEFLNPANRLGHRDAMVTATIYAHVSDQQAETASSTFANAVNGGRL